jgi:vacuolar-type H+-ATPase subunit C/Vma6
LIPVKKNADKYWYKALKKLILDEDLRKSLGQGLYDTFSDKYNLKTVTNKRAEFYESVVQETLKV